MTDIGSMPLEEALQHYGVRGMKWGVRKKDPDWDREGPDPNKNVKRVAIAATVAVGAATTYVVLKKYGGTPISIPATGFSERFGTGPTPMFGEGTRRAAGAAAGKAREKFNARNARKVYDGVVEDGPNMARGAAKAASRFGDIIDAEVVNNGATAVRALPPGVWKTPIAAIAR